MLLPLLSLSLLIHLSSPIDLKDQPRLFSTLAEWNQNLFMRVADCIRDTMTSETDSVVQLNMKAWASLCCNQILSTLNQNDVSTTADFNTLSVLVNQEYCWRRIAFRIYGIRTQTQACGIQSSEVPDCVYVTP